MPVSTCLGMSGLTVNVNALSIYPLAGVLWICQHFRVLIDGDSTLFHPIQISTMSSCLQFCVLQLNLGEFPLGTTEMYAVKPTFGPSIVVLPCLWRAELDLLWSGINPS